jgi:hypothetical protein
MQDDFNVDDFKIDGKLPIGKRSAGKRTSRRRPAKEHFARIPHKRGLALYGMSGAAWTLLVALDQQIFKTHKNPVSMPNRVLKAIGMGRSTKQRALHQLEEKGVITVEQDGHKATTITHHWFPRRA